VAHKMHVVIFASCAPSDFSFRVMPVADSHVATDPRRVHGSTMAALLEHYGLTGDATTVALISRAGSLDWLCLPRIDSDACFAKLLGTDEHGYWTIRPAAEVRAVARRYARTR
jgi:hypothetical protein